MCVKSKIILSIFAVNGRQQNEFLLLYLGLGIYKFLEFKENNLDITTFTTLFINYRDNS
jgi:hypothetical protein